LNYFLTPEQQMIRDLARKIALEKVIPVWADPDEVQPLPKENSFRRDHHLKGKFVVMYAGNIGLTSCLEDVIGAAEVLKSNAEIQFVIVGEGVKKEMLEAQARTRALSNILFMPYQPREIFPEMLAAADVSLVTLNAVAMLSSLPSKIFNVMASARPVLSVAPPESEQAHILRESGCGRNVAPECPEELAGAIMSMKSAQPALNQMGQNGRVYFEKYYTRRHCVQAYESMLVNLCSPHDIKTASTQGNP
jgi:colanic acid biosynthesis glycosyl transferase WcaI